jgi:hypothetical protein
MKKIIIILLAIGFLAGVSSCVREKFSSPPVTNADPNLTANATISQLNALLANSTSGASFQITSNLIISAIVVGDDRSGNLYKELAIEDSTGGIMLMITASDLYANYPVGRRLFVQLQGLYVVNYDGGYEIVASVDNGTFSGLSPANLSQYVIPGKWGITVVPKVVTVSQLTANANAYQNQLVQLNNVEFITGQRGVAYANPTFLLSGSLYIKDCNESMDTVYTSGYASFAGALSPTGNGTMVCIAGVYNGLSQLIIRDTTDLNLTGPVCP